MRYDDINVDMLYIDSHEYINKVNNSIFDKLWCLMNLVSKYYIELFTLGINKCSLAEFMVNVHNGNIYSKKKHDFPWVKILQFLCTIKTQKGEVLAKLSL